MDLTCSGACGKLWSDLKFDWYQNFGIRFSGVVITDDGKYPEPEEPIKMCSECYNKLLETEKVFWVKVKR